ncbi:MAG: hypothetical protein RML73_06415 [Anaerolineae bacterium]|nr:hypothetical protein [Anaerolineae bacterium]
MRLLSRVANGATALSDWFLPRSQYFVAAEQIEAIIAALKQMAED